MLILEGCVKEFGLYPKINKEALKHFKQSSDMILFCFSSCKLILIIDRTDKREQAWRQRGQLETTLQPAWRHLRL